MFVGGLITAGGMGIRMGSPLPKQFLELDGIPILRRTMEVFLKHPLIQKVVVTVPDGHTSFCEKHILSGIQTEKEITIAVGGLNRQQSVFNGLLKLEDTDLVAIHDGVRPFVSPEVITRTIDAAHKAGAAIAAVPIRETVKRKIGDRLETVNREGLWLAHTPQAFQTDLIVRAHKEALSIGFLGTDDAALVERLGHPVAIVNDFHENIKITTPADLVIATVIAKGQRV